jgi:hypothetical protein
MKNRMNKLFKNKKNHKNYLWKNKLNLNKFYKILKIKEKKSLIWVML